MTKTEKPTFTDLTKPKRPEEVIGQLIGETVAAEQRAKERIANVLKQQQVGIKAPEGSPETKLSDQVIERQIAQSRRGKSSS